MPVLALQSVRRSTSWRFEPESREQQLFAWRIHASSHPLPEDLRSFVIAFINEPVDEGDLAVIRFRSDHLRVRRVYFRRHANGRPYLEARGGMKGAPWGWDRSGEGIEQYDANDIAAVYKVREIIRPLQIDREAEKQFFPQERSVNWGGSWHKSFPPARIVKHA